MTPFRIVWLPWEYSDFYINPSKYKENKQNFDYIIQSKEIESLIDAIYKIKKDHNNQISLV